MKLKCTFLGITSLLGFTLFTWSSIGQITILTSYGQGDAGIDVIMPNLPVTMEWSQFGSYSDVSISAGVGSINSTGAGWAELTSGANVLAFALFSYPNSVGGWFVSSQIDLFDGLNLPAGTYDLTIGAYTGSDVGWGVPAEDILYEADNVAYINTYTHWGLSYPVDFSIVSVPEPSMFAALVLGFLAIKGRHFLRLD